MSAYKYLMKKKERLQYPDFAFNDSSLCYRCVGFLSCIISVQYNYLTI